MQRRYNISWKNAAKKDLHCIFAYIISRSSVERAQYVLQGISDAVYRVAFMPQKHAVEPWYNRQDIRFTTKWKYKIIFLITQDEIHILRVFHTAQSTRKIRLTI
jgi:plasmid stabilization system protein ParE